MRPQILKFAEKMEEKLKQNDHKGGWEDCELDWLLNRLKEETIELENEIHPEYILNVKNVENEAIDMANFAMMIAEMENQRKDEVIRT